jgi:hypothetical protein
VFQATRRYNRKEENTIEKRVNGMEEKTKRAICQARFCSYPHPDDRGWCVNCNYPVTEETKASWRNFVAIDSNHKKLIDALLNG